MSRMMMMREIFSLLAGVLMLAMAIWIGKTESWSDSYLYFGIAIVILLFYILRRRLRQKFEEEQKNK